ncbi:hypothetical protein M3Y99_01205700 [Aphelenchoides fujianensis]|nr:hypothetical protein M3Y99_01205700 [Aphelenchoides fujianensis]
MAASQQKDELMDGIKRQRELVSSLRQQVLDLDRHVERVYRPAESGAAGGDVEEARAEFRKAAEQLERTFEGLETDTQLMAQQRERWNTHEMSRLNTFLLDALADPNNAELYERALRLTNARETMDQYTSYAMEFLKLFSQSTSRRRQPRITPDVLAANSENLDAALKPLLTGNLVRNGRLRYRWLERSAFGGLLEVCHVLPTQPQRGEVDVVKMGFLVHNGVLDYAQFLATHEDWSYREENRRQVDLSVQSKYHFFRRLSAVVNHTWLPNVRASGSQTLAPWIARFSAFANFEQTCRHCKRHLRHFMPPIIDKAANSWVHEACK